MDGTSEAISFLGRIPIAKSRKLEGAQMLFI
jgi:hypothetical protein